MDREINERAVISTSAQRQEVFHSDGGAAKQSTAILSLCVCVCITTSACAFAYLTREKNMFLGMCIFKIFFSLRTINYLPL